MRIWCDPVSNVGICILNVIGPTEAIYNFTSGAFEPLPPDGKPTDAHVMKPKFLNSGKGSFGRLAYVDPPFGLALPPGAVAVAVTLPTIGSTGDMESMIGIDSGVRRLTLTMSP